MVDLETLGVSDNAPITQLGAVIFNLETGDILDKIVLYRNFKEDDFMFESFIQSMTNINRENRENMLQELDTIFEQQKRLTKEYSIEKDTMLFWIDNDSNYNKLVEILHYDNSHSEKDIALLFSKFISDFKENNNVSLTIWGNGISFDVVKINRMLDRHNIPREINFRKERDVRTLLDLALDISGMSDLEFFEKIPNNTYKHDALADAIYQAQYCHGCYLLLKGER